MLSTQSTNSLDQVTFKRTEDQPLTGNLSSMESIRLRVDRTLDTLGSMNTHEYHLNNNVSNYLETTDGSNKDFSQDKK